MFFCVVYVLLFAIFVVKEKYKIFFNLENATQI